MLPDLYWPMLLVLAGAVGAIVGKGLWEAHAARRQARRVEGAAIRLSPEVRALFEAKQGGHHHG